MFSVCNEHCKSSRGPEVVVCPSVLVRTRRHHGDQTLVLIMQNVISEVLVQIREKMWIVVGWGRATRAAPHQLTDFLERKKTPLKASTCHPLKSWCLYLHINKWWITHCALEGVDIRTKDEESHSLSCGFNKYMYWHIKLNAPRGDTANLPGISYWQ